MKHTFEMVDKLYNLKSDYFDRDTLLKEIDMDILFEEFKNVLSPFEISFLQEQFFNHSLFNIFTHYTDTLSMEHFNEHHTLSDVCKILDYNFTRFFNDKHVQEFYKKLTGNDLDSQLSKMPELFYTSLSDESILISQDSVINYNKKEVIEYIKVRFMSKFSYLYHLPFEYYVKYLDDNFNTVNNETVMLLVMFAESYGLEVATQVNKHLINLGGFEDVYKERINDLGKVHSTLIKSKYPLVLENYEDYEGNDYLNMFTSILSEINYLLNSEELDMFVDILKD